MTEAFRAEKGAAAASSYRIDGDAITPGTASVGNGRSEICWAVISNDGRYAFTTNFADGAVSRYAIGMDGVAARSRTRPPAITEDGRPGLRDEDLSDDGRFLYAIDADQGQIVGLVGRRRGHAVDDRLVGRPADHRRRARGRLMQLETLLPGDVHDPRVVERHPAEGDGRGTEGQSFLIAEGRAEGRLSARYRAANYPRRRVDGALEPAFRGVLETDDGATILFHWEGLATMTAVRHATAARHDPAHHRRRAVPLAQRSGVRASKARSGRAPKAPASTSYCAST